MTKSTSAGIINIINLIAKKLIFFISLIILSISASFGQAPTWVPAAPTATPYATNIVANFGINVPGTVYGFLISFDYVAPVTPADVKLYSGQPINSGRIRNIQRIVSGGNVGITLNELLENDFTSTPLTPNTIYSVFLVAEDNATHTLTNVVKILLTTPPCPKIQLFTFFGNLGECVNLGAQGMFQAAPLGPLPTGILKGTTWTIDWGDGSPVWTYNSASNNDIPPLQTHLFATTSNCAYIGRWSVKNPCNEFLSSSSVFVVHGRDIPADGDGLLRMEEVTTHTPDIIYLCEGKQYNITLADISRWNCQSPNVPAPLNPADYDNDKPRTIQFVYGETPSGAVMNTITGNVLIGGTNIANGADGYVGPVITPINPPNPRTQSSVITIPATCSVGQRFYVYIKNWNKCNPYTGNPAVGYEFEDFIIEIIDSPPAPVVVTPQSACVGSVPLTISAAPNLPGNTLKWYADAALTLPLGTGLTLTHGKTAVGTYPFWVTETSGVNGCEGPAAQIDLVINPLPNKPTISNTGDLEFCYDGGITTITLTANVVTPPAVSSYQWYKGGVAVPGATASTIVLGALSTQTGFYTVRAYGVNPTNCPGPLSDPVSVIIHSLSNLTNPVPVTVCENGTVTFSANTTDLVQNWQWEVSSNGGSSYSTCGNGSPYSGGFSNTLTISPADYSLNGNLYRIEIKTPPGQGGCPFKSNAALLTVNQVPTANAGPATTSICQGGTTIGLGGSIGGGATGGTWSTTAGGVFTPSATNLNATWTPPGAYSGTATLILTTNGGACGTTTASKTQIVNPTSVGGTISGGSTPVCIGSNTGVMTLSGYTGAITRWEKRVNAGGWINIINTATTYSEIPSSVGTWDYRVLVTSGSCPGVYSSTKTIVVNPLSNGGTLSGGITPICQGTNTGLLTVAGYTGAITRWQKRVNSGGWTNIVNTNPTYSEVPSSAGTWDYRVLVTSGACAGAYSTIQTIIVDPTTVGGTTTGGSTVCVGSTTGLLTLTGYTGGVVQWQFSTDAGVSWTNIANTLPTYTSAPIWVAGIYWVRAQVRSGLCLTQFSSYTIVTVNPPSVGGSITGGNTPICYNVNTGVMTLSGHTGSVVQWEKRVDGGAWSVISNNTTTYSEIPSSSGTWDYRALVQNNPCAPIYSALRTIFVRPILSLAQLHDDASICNNSSTNINVVMTGGTSPFTVNYTKNGVPQGAWNNYISGTNVNTGLLLANTTYALTSVTDNFGCPAQSLGTSILITVGSAPTVATLTGSGNGCFGTTSTIRSVITGGAPTYTINYTRNGIAQGPVTFYNSGTNINLGILPVGTYNYQITSVTDLCGNSVPVGGLPGVYTIVIDPVPDISGTVPAAQTICNDGSAAVTLNSTVNNTIFNYAVASVPAAGYSWTAGKNPVAGSITDADGNGTESISRQLQHNYTDPVVVTYTITPTGPGATACPGTPVTRTVTVNPTSVITSAATKTICDNASTAYTATSSTAGATFAWTRAVVAGIANPIGSGATSAINENLDNTTTAPVVVRYVITPSYGFCAGTPFNLDVTVNPTAVITSAATKTICDNASTVYTATSSTAGATFAWTRAVVAGIANPIGSGATSAINENLDNTTIAPVVVRYVITPSYGTCTGTPFNLDVTVNPTAVITSASTATVCDNTALGYTATSSTAGATFAWTRAVVAGIANPVGSGATSSINESLDNTTTAPVVVRYVITPSNGLCAGTPFNLDVTVNPTAVVTSAATKTICDNASTAYTATSSTAGATFAWTRAVVAGIANPIGSGATSAINENLDNTTTAPVVVRYVITPSYGTCTGTPFNFDVTVNPTAVIMSAATATVCDNTPLGYTATSSTGGATFAWTRAVVAGISNPIGSGATSSINESLDNTTTAPVVVRYVITPSVGVCAGTPFNLDVTVNPTAVITSAATKTICDNAATAYTATSSTAGATFAWTRAVVAGIANPIGSGATSSINENLDNTTTAPVVVRYIITPSVGTCTGTPFNLDVTINPTAVITSAATATVCDNTPLGYTATSSTAGATFAWTRAVVAGISNAIGSGATSSINESLDNTTTAPVVVRYVITPSVGVCAGTPFNLDVTVNPTAVITSAATATVCDNTPLGYTATSSTGGATFAWTRAVVAGISNPIGSGATSSINESLDNTTTAPVVVRYVITPSVGVCAGTPFNLDVTVNPTAVITSAATKTICDNAATAYTATSSTAGATFAWTRAVVAGIANPIGSGATSSINENLDNTTPAPVVVRYIITPSVGTCTGTPFNLDVTINPTAVITSAATATVCDNTPLGYTATSSTAGATFAWTRAVVAGISNAIGSGATSSINESLDNTTTAPVVVRYVITPSVGVCTGTPFNLDVTVNPTAVITSAATKTICDNASTAYTATSSTAGATFAWTRAVVAGIANPIGSGATSSINENLDNTTTAAVVVRYVITPSYGGCAGTPFNLDVTVNPTAVITSAATKTICDNASTAYTATSSTAGSTFAWTRAVVAGIANPIGSGATSSINENLDNTTTAPVVVRYVITPSYGTCTGTPFNLDVTVNPNGDVTQPGNQVLCNGSSTTAVIFGTANTVGVTTYSWTNSAPGIGLAASGNGDIAAFTAVNNGAAPILASIVVTPTFTNGGVGCTGPTKTFTITVNPTPTLSTSLTPAAICSNTVFSYAPASATGRNYI